MKVALTLITMAASQGCALFVLGVSLAPSPPLSHCRFKVAKGYFNPHPRVVTPRNRFPLNNPPLSNMQSQELFDFTEKVYSTLPRELRDYVYQGLSDMPMAILSFFTKGEVYTKPEAGSKRHNVACLLRGICCTHYHSPPDLRGTLLPQPFNHLALT